MAIPSLSSADVAVSSPTARNATIMEAPSTQQVSLFSAADVAASLPTTGTGTDPKPVHKRLLGDLQ